MDDLNPNLYYRITDLIDAGTITGNEVVEAVQDGKNVKFTLAQLFSAGKSAYEVAVENGFDGNQAEWLATLIGKSAYQIAVSGGYVGSESTWIASLTGKSAYQVAVAGGYTGTQPEWIASLKGITGDTGKSAYDIAVETGYSGSKSQWVTSLIGLSAYQIAVNNGFAGSLTEWLASLDGIDGKSAYTQARENGFVGTEAEWIVSLTGKSAYQIAVDGGFVGSQAEWVISLQGKKGDTGDSALDVLIDNFPSVTDAASMALFLKGEKGEIGVGTRIVGTLLSEGELPDPDTAYAVNEAYLIKNELYVVVSGEWNNMGDISGPEGMGLRIKGSLNNINELPTENNISGDSYIIARLMLVWDGTRWSEMGQVGPTGASAYEAAVAEGFVGSQAVWLASLKGTKGDEGKEGKKGDTGDIGPAGPSLKYKGTFPDLGSLYAVVTSPVNADLAVVGRYHYIYDGSVWNQTVMVVGRDGIDGTNGTDGENGEDGTNGKDGTNLLEVIQVAHPEIDTPEKLAVFLKGEKGDDGKKGDTGEKGEGADALRVKGELTSETELPEDAIVGDSYIVRGNIFSLSTSGWIDLGRFTGMNAYQLAVQEGFVGGINTWLESLNGTDGRNGTDGTNGEDGDDGVDGKSAYQIAVDGGFVGTEAEWNVSLKGEGLKIDGAGPTTSYLPPAPVLGEPMLIYLIGTNLYIGKDGVWTDAGTLRGEDGTDGKDGSNLLEVIQEIHPEIDTPEKLAVFLKGVQGDEGKEGNKGDTGDTGPAGPSLKYRGTYADLTELYAAVLDPVNADFAVVGRYHYIYDGSVWNQTVMVVGRDGVDGINGTNGKDGTDGTNGDDGADGKGLIIKGEVTAEANLPIGASVGDGYLIAGDLWIMGIAGYFNAGKLRGTDGEDGEDGTNGKTAYETAVELGYIGSPAEWIASLAGKDGKSAYESATENGFEGTEEEWVVSLTGKTGADGPMGPGVKILGTRGSSAELPMSGNIVGDGYLINSHFWGWDGTAWIDCGPVQGPVGPVGPPGPSVKGNPGPKGERGSSIILMSRNPTALDGAVTDVAMNTVTQGLWLKSSTTQWTFIGTFGGGNVYSPNPDGKQYVRVGGEWVPLSPPSDDKAYIRKGPEWVQLSPPDDGFRYARVGEGWARLTADPATDGFQYARSGAEWVRLGTDPANDGKQYVRVGSTWQQFNHYDLTSTPTTGLCDLSVGNVFTLDNTTAGTRTITLANLPNGRATTIILLITGTAGAFNWPGSVIWGENTPPVLGALLTNLVFMWDGSRLIGSVGMKA